MNLINRTLTKSYRGRVITVPYLKGRIVAKKAFLPLSSKEIARRALKRAEKITAQREQRKNRTIGIHNEIN